MIVTHIPGVAVTVREVYHEGDNGLDQFLVIHHGADGMPLVAVPIGVKEACRLLDLAEAAAKK